MQLFLCFFYLITFLHNYISDMSVPPFLHTLSFLFQSSLLLLWSSVLQGEKKVHQKDSSFKCPLLFRWQVNRLPTSHYLCLTQLKLDPPSPFSSLSWGYFNIRKKSTPETPKIPEHYFRLSKSSNHSIYGGDTKFPRGEVFCVLSQLSKGSVYN